ncbi:MAG: sensor histidine kinase [Spirochaetaceae bacterium]|nr:MAG: sensor histidine kinase [Spirochaetaceae bacterium]
MYCMEHAAVPPGSRLVQRFVSRIRARFGIGARVEELQTKLDERNRVLSTIAHELRTPLTVMQTTTALLLEESTGPLSERQREFLESMSGTTTSMVRFVEGILAEIKVDRAWMPLDARPLDLRRIIRRVRTAMQPLLDERRQTLQTTVPSLLTRPLGNETWIHHVLTNLVHNAAKHAGERGTIVVSVTEHDECVAVTVSDNGHGLVTTGRERLFEEFYQEEPVSDAAFEGTGLGLAIVRNVIERHGGRVYVTTAPGLGTMVSFTLPLPQLGDTEPNEPSRTAG